MTHAPQMALRGIAAAVALCTSLGAGAHSQYILPSSTILSKAQYVTFDGAVTNEMFYANHNALRLDNVAATAPDGSTVTIENTVTGKLRSVFDVNITQPGTYRIHNAFDGVTARYKDAAGAQKGWRGKASELEANVPKDATEVRVNEQSSRLETFVTLGKPTPIKATGKGLEFVPVTHPNDLVAGEAATLAFQIDGKPAADLEVEIIPGGMRYRDKVGDFKVKTDAQGQVKVTFKDPGFHRIEISTRAPGTIPQVKERRLVYAAVLEVLAP